MAGIANRYFTFAHQAPTVQSMPVDPFALGVFQRPASPEFTELVREDRVLDISDLGTINDLLADWSDAFERLSQRAGSGHRRAAGVHGPATAPGRNRRPQLAATDSLGDGP